MLKRHHTVRSYLCFLVIGASLIFILTVSGAGAEVYHYGKDNTIIGALRTYRVKKGESLIEIARRFKLGYNEIADANPGLDPFVPRAGASVNIPSSWVLPDVGAYDGIVINVSEMRLYYFFKQKGTPSVKTFPIGIGDEGTDTPIGSFRVVEKIVRPAWHVPESIRRERPELPRVVMPGPDNPLGSHALRLSLGSILIHGTNKPWGVGRRVSHGCIRLYPEDIPELYRLVPNGVRVTIVQQPVKVGLKGSKVYVEVHRDEDMKDFNYLNEAVRLLSKRGLLKEVNTEKLYRAVEEKRGTPVNISD